MGPTKNLTYLLHHVSSVMGKQSDQVLQEQLGIGLSQYKILMVLEWNPRVQQRAVARDLVMRRPDRRAAAPLAHVGVFQRPDR